MDPMLLMFLLSAFGQGGSQFLGQDMGAPQGGSILDQLLPMLLGMGGGVNPQDQSMGQSGQSASDLFTYLFGPQAGQQSNAFYNPPGGAGGQNFNPPVSGYQGGANPGGGNTGTGQPGGGYGGTIESGPGPGYYAAPGGPGYVPSAFNAMGRMPSYGQLPAGVSAPDFAGINSGFGTGGGAPYRYNPWTTDRSQNYQTPAMVSDYMVRNRIQADVNRQMGRPADSQLFFVADANQYGSIPQQNIQAWDLYSQAMNNAGLQGLLGQEPAAIAAARARLGMPSAGGPAAGGVPAALTQQGFPMGGSPFIGGGNAPSTFFNPGGFADPYMGRPAPAPYFGPGFAPSIGGLPSQPAWQPPVTGHPGAVPTMGARTNPNDPYSYSNPGPHYRLTS
jgi:hypothetical protein